MRGICPHCGKEIEISCVLMIKEPKIPFFSTRKAILWELEKRKSNCLTLRVLAKRCGFKRSTDHEFRTALNQLVKEGLVTIFRSGYSSEPTKYHAWVARLGGS